MQSIVSEKTSLLALDSWVEEVLALENRNRASLLYGCFDRSFWKYRLVTDFPSATYQAPVWGLSRVYAEEISGPYFRNPHLLEWIRAGLLYGASIQNRDGSFSEWFAQERSFCATAFTAGAVAESCLILREELDKDAISKLTASLRKSAVWLTRSQEGGLASNQLAAASWALLTVSLLLSDSKIKLAAETKMEILLKRQNFEGWFPEYGGADTAYSFLMLSLLTRYYQLAPTEKLKAAIGSLAEFLQCFVHPDGSSGGEYTSRGASGIFWDGVFEAASISSSAASLKEQLLSRNPGWTAQGPHWDDKYRAFFGFNSMIRALLASGREAQSHDLPVSYSSGVKFKDFHQAGLVLLSTESYQVWLGAKRGGTLRVYSGDKLFYQDAGYLLNCEGERFVSHAFQPKASYTIHGKLRPQLNLEIEVQTPFFKVPCRLEKTRALIPFKLISNVLGRIPGFSQLLSSLLKKKFFMNSKPALWSLKRRFVFSETTVRVEDTLVGPKGKEDFEAVKCRSLLVGKSPFSDFFYPGELQTSSEREGPEAGIPGVLEINFKGEPKITYPKDGNHGT